MEFYLYRLGLGFDHSTFRLDLSRFNVCGHVHTTDLSDKNGV